MKRKVFAHSQKSGFIPMLLAASYLAYSGYADGDYFILFLGLALLVICLTNARYLLGTSSLVLEEESFTVPRTGPFNEEKRIFWTDIKGFKVRSRSLLILTLRDGTTRVINLRNFKGEDRDEFLREFAERCGEDISKVEHAFAGKSSKVLVIGLIVLVVIFLLWE